MASNAQGQSLDTDCGGNACQFAITLSGGGDGCTITGTTVTATSGALATTQILAALTSSTWSACATLPTITLTITGTPLTSETNAPLYTAGGAFTLSWADSATRYSAPSITIVNGGTGQQACVHSDPLPVASAAACTYDVTLAGGTCMWGPSGTAITLATTSTVAAQGGVLVPADFADIELSNGASWSMCTVMPSVSLALVTGCAATPSGTVAATTGADSAITLDTHLHLNPSIEVTTDGTMQTGCKNTNAASTADAYDKPCEYTVSFGSPCEFLIGAVTATTAVTATATVGDDFTLVTGSWDSCQTTQPTITLTLKTGFSESNPSIEGGATRTPVAPVYAFTAAGFVTASTDTFKPAVLDSACGDIPDGIPDDIPEFWGTFIGLLISFFILSWPAIYVLSQSKWNARRIAPFLALAQKKWHVQKWSISKKLSLRQKTLWTSIFIFGVPILLYVLLVRHTIANWGPSQGYPRTGHELFGVALMLLMPAVWFGLCTLMAWEARKWRVGGIEIALTLTLAWVLFSAFQLTAVFVSEPYCFLGFSWVFLLLSLFPMVGVVYLNGDFRVEGMDILMTKLLAGLRAADIAHALLEPDPKDHSFALDKPVMVDIDGDGELDASIGTGLTAEYRLSMPPSAAARALATRAMTLLWGVSLLVLSVYCWAHRTLMSVTLTSELKHEHLAAVTSLAVIILDGSCLTAQAQGLPHCKSPATTASMMGVNRALLLVVGPDFWFVGHALSFLVTGTLWCAALAADIVPLSTLERATKEAQLRAEAEDKALQKTCITSRLVRLGILGHPRYWPTTQFALIFLTVVFAMSVYMVDQIRPEGLSYQHVELDIFGQENCTAHNEDIAEFTADTNMQNHSEVFAGFFIRPCTPIPAVYEQSVYGGYALTLVIVQLPLRCAYRLLDESNMRWSIATVLCAFGVQVVMLSGGIGIYWLSRGANEMYFTLALFAVIGPMMFTLQNFLYLWLKRDFFFFKQKSKDMTPNPTSGAEDDDSGGGLDKFKYATTKLRTLRNMKLALADQTEEEEEEERLRKMQMSSKRNKRRFLGGFRSKLEVGLKGEALDIDEDFKTGLCIVVFFVCLTGFGVVVSKFEKPFWLGSATCGMVVVMLLSILPAYELIETGCELNPITQPPTGLVDRVLSLLLGVHSRPSLFVLYSCFSAIVTYMVGVICYRWKVLEGESELLLRDNDGNYTNKIDWDGFMLHVAALMYPAWFFCALALYKLRDDNWKVSRFPQVCLVLSQCFVLMLEIAIWMNMGEWGRGAGMGLMAVNCIVLYLLYLVSQWVSHDFYLPSKWQRLSAYLILGIVLTVGGVMGDYSEDFTEYGHFYGFSLSWFSVMIAAYCYMRTLNVLAVKKDGVHHYEIAMQVFPVYRWMPEKRQIEQHNEGNRIALYISAMGVIWGLVATVFYKPIWIGLAASSASVACIFIHVIDTMRKPVLEFIEAEQTIMSAVQEQLADEELGRKAISAEDAEQQVWLHAIIKSVEAAEIELVYNARDHAHDETIIGSGLSKIRGGIFKIGAKVKGTAKGLTSVSGVIGLGKDLVGNVKKVGTGVVGGVKLVGGKVVGGVTIVGNTVKGVGGALAHSALSGDLALGNKLAHALDAALGEEKEEEEGGDEKATMRSAEDESACRAVGEDGEADDSAATGYVDRNSGFVLKDGTIDLSSMSSTQLMALQSSVIAQASQAGGYGHKNINATMARIRTLQFEVRGVIAARPTPEGAVEMMEQLLELDQQLANAYEEEERFAIRFQMQFGMIARTMSSVAEVRFQQFVRWIKELVKKDVVPVVDGEEEDPTEGLGNTMDDQLLKAALAAEAVAEKDAKERRHELRQKVYAIDIPILIELLHEQNVSMKAVRNWPMSIRLGLREMRELHDLELQVQLMLKAQREALESLKKDLRRKRLAKSAKGKKDKLIGGIEERKSKEEVLQKRLDEVQEARKHKEEEVSKLEIRAHKFKECEQEHDWLMKEMRTLLAEMLVLSEEEEFVSTELEQINADESTNVLEQIDTDTMSRFHKAVEAGVPFEDMEFQGVDALGGGAASGVTWKRPHEWLRGKGKPVMGDFNATDMNQGSLGDCWLLSAIAVCAHHDEQPGLDPDKRFLPKVMALDLYDGEKEAEKISHCGAYVVRFCIDGAWVPVLIDEKIPCNFSGPKVLSGCRQCCVRSNGRTSSTSTSSVVLVLIE
jgi:hypothetical protein